MTELVRVRLQGEEGEKGRRKREGGISHIRMQMMKIWNICLSDLEPAQAGNACDTDTHTDTHTHTHTAEHTATVPVSGVLRVPAIH